MYETFTWTLAAGNNPAENDTFAGVYKKYAVFPQWDLGRGGVYETTRGFFYKGQGTSGVQAQEEHLRSEAVNILLERRP